MGSREGKDDSRHSDPNIDADPAVLALRAAFLEALRETDDVRAAFDAVLTNDSVLAGLSAQAPTAIDEVEFQNALRALDRTKSTSAPVLAAAFTNMQKMLRMLPALNAKLAEKRARIIAAGGTVEDLPSPREVYELLIEQVYDPSNPPEVAAGFIGFIIGPMALALYAEADRVSPDYGRDVVAVANEATHDALRFLVAMLTALDVGVDDGVLPASERFDLQAAVDQHSAGLLS